MRERRHIFQNIDWAMVLLYLLLVFAGWINIYAAVYNQEHQSILDISQNYGKQLIWIGTSVFLGLVILFIDSKFYHAFSYPIYFLVMLSLVAVLLVGKKVAGATSWFAIGSFSIQPSEFAKMATALALAHFLSGMDVDLKKLRTKLISGIIIGLPAVLILLQNDTGSALVYFSLILVLYREGMSGDILIIGFITAVLFVLTLLIDQYIVLGIYAAGIIAFAVFLKRSKRNYMILAALLIAGAGLIFSVHYAFNNILEEHQKTRINVLLGKEKDIHGAGYNVHQSLIAIGSGGFSGKGFLQGTQTKYDFVPEQSTDFIFCTVGEEWGFLGTATTILLFCALLFRIVYVAERQRSHFSRIYGYAVFSILFFHFAINIGMTIGLVPVIGIPLPFFSYGGSSLWGFTVLLFVFIRMDASRLQLL